MQPPKKPQRVWLLSILIPLSILSSVVLVLVLVVRPGGSPSPLVLGGIVTLLFAWIGVSVLWPARPDRRCPSCQGETLERMHASTAEGLVCKVCGWSDATASGWYMAEEELDALEPLAMERRAARAARK